MNKRKPRTIYCVEREEIYPNMANSPVLWGCFKTKSDALCAAKYHRKECKEFTKRRKSDKTLMTYGKVRVVKFVETKTGG